MNNFIETGTAPSGPSTFTVDLGERAYDIIVGENLLPVAGTYLRAVMAQPMAFVVTDEHVAPLYLQTVAQSLRDAGIETESLVLPAGEGTKCFERLQQVVDWMLDHRIERGATVVALGGGVIGDLAGFAASIVLRGINVVQIPTSLLAQADSSVGGKTGINARQGKNLIGTFHQPALVLADVGVLDTLPPRELLAGYAETVKYGLIADAPFFDWLEANGEAFCAGDRSVRTRAILHACAAKADVVAEDERETGRRALLNLGHTFGHAFEAETGYGERLLHGEAVAIGMVMAFDLSAAMGLCPAADAERARRHVAARGLPVDLSGLAEPSWTAEKLISHMTSDKKVRGKRATFILARSIGDCFTTQDVDPGFLRRFLEKCLAP